MAASVDMTAGGTGGTGDLNVLVQALDRFTSALQGVAKSVGVGGMPGGEPGGLLRGTSAPQPKGGVNGAPGKDAALGGQKAPALTMPDIGGLFSKLLPPQFADIGKTVSGLGEHLTTFAERLKVANVGAGKLPASATKMISLAGIFGSKLVTIGGGLMKVLGPIGIAASVLMLAKKIPVVGELMEIGTQSLLRPLRGVGAAFSDSLVPLRQFQERAGVVASAVKNLGQAQYSYSQAIGNSSNLVASTVAGGMDRVTAVLANPIAEIPQLIGELRPFVEAFNPVAMMEFDQAMRSVMAVIGEALVPVVRIASALLREFAGYLRPIMRQLEPIIAQVAQVAGGFLKEIMPLLPEFINSLLPVLRQYANELKENMTAMTAYNNGQFTMLDKVRYKLSEWTGGLISKPKFEAKAAGLPPGVMKENISSYGAAEAPTFKGTADLGRDLMQSAFVARPGELKDDTAKATEENTAKAASLLEQLVDINKGAETYDARVAAGGMVGGATSFTGSIVAGIYNFNVGASNLLTGNKLAEGMVDI
jgi:hypothetical protein